MGKQVITHTGGPHEDIRQYLNNQRNPKAYRDITAEKQGVWDWNDIYDEEERKKYWGI
jgi:hypothetical protein